MNVPFHSSGALSRAHYAIVRKVESAAPGESVEQDILLEIKAVRERLVHPKLSLSQCKECLIILLYCAMSVSPGILPRDAFEFALFHAINLAEAGVVIGDKRIGYLFCAEMLPLGHELRLMLINTLRKDLESGDIPLVCLALDNLISSPSEDVIPAVESCLHDLLLYKSSCVRRRALLAFRALASLNPALLGRIHKPLLDSFHDPDETVVKAALIVSAHASTNTIFRSELRSQLSGMLKVAGLRSINHGLTLRILIILGLTGLSRKNIPVLLDILVVFSPSDQPTTGQISIILEIFRLLGQADEGDLISFQKKQGVSAVQCIRQLLSPHTPNYLHVFVSCLECIPSSSWAGTKPEYPSVLDGFEFERIMQLLVAPDAFIRVKALETINRIDPGILDAQYSKTAEAGLMNHPNTTAMRLLEILAVRYKHDGEGYGARALDLIENSVDNVSSKSQSSPDIVTVVLNTHPGDRKFRIGCAMAFVNALIDTEQQIGPTAMIIMVALATELCGSLVVKPLAILSSLAARLSMCSRNMQHVCVLAMLWISAHCDEVPQDLVNIVAGLRRSADGPLRFCCDQFLALVGEKDVLVKLLRDSGAETLPDFFRALKDHIHKSEGGSEATNEFPSSRPTSPQGRASHRQNVKGFPLRYAAYKPPTHTPRLAERRLSDSQRSGSSSHSAPRSDLGRGHERVGSPLMTAGDLTLAEGFQGLKDSLKTFPTGNKDRTAKTADPPVDLIALDPLVRGDPFSPFETQRAIKTPNNFDFEEAWNTIGTTGDLRGWCNVSIDVATRRLQAIEGYHLRTVSTDLPPFIGELKILIVPDRQRENRLSHIECVALRLRESEEDSCLWRLRCNDIPVGTSIKELLS